ncbi:threonine-phosphate decarboxylase [Salipaludibacillus keqinensis]|uniref:threonine-phosphate decarboxylase n=1 Tax=Salipaludibacillus keqinensis TaxID=2045207 RepID=A0A323T9D2_9BACI|nr:threonine-phosphate decarboxylase CobD [Salipaludibacillus keqinensis]PYZ92312.1 threonine-phosphate decarboxylase [Salipaludibacillus keqinensis]
MKWPNHGGQPAAIKRQFHLLEDEVVVDFSANIHPLGPPVWVKDHLKKSFDLISQYPDPTYWDARTQIAAFEGVTADHVLVTNGGAEAIFLTAKFFEGKRALIIEPTFSEYEQACRHYHLDVDHVYSDAEEDFAFPLNKTIEHAAEVEVVFICRPNNPTGTVVSVSDIRSLLEKTKEKNTYVVVDEAFVDFLPNETDKLTPLLKEFSHLILLRSLTKMYAIPGIRVGFMMAHEQVIGQVQNWQTPWSVNVFASTMIQPLLKDYAFVSRSRDYFKEELLRIRRRLHEMDYYMSSSAVNFYLLRDEKHPNCTIELFQFLLKKGILPRHTDNFKGLDGNYLRFAIRSKAENDQLLDTLKAWREER